MLLKATGIRNSSEETMVYIVVQSKEKCILVGKNKDSNAIASFENLLEFTKEIVANRLLEEERE